MNDQAANLRRQFGEGYAKKDALTVSIVSGKGGVGKSNVALNLAIELQNMNKKVMLFDLDIGMGNIDVLLGLHTKYTIIDMLNNSLPIQDIIETGPNGLAYISGGSGINHLFSIDESKRNYFLKEYQQISDTYDYVLFDMGAGATRDSMFFLQSSDECIVVTTPEPTAFTDAYSMVKQILISERNMPIYVVMNRCLSMRQGKKSVDHFNHVVKRFLDVDIKSLGLLPEDRVVTESVMKQTPFALFKPRSQIAQAMRQLAITYVTSKKTCNRPSKLSFIQRLKQFLGEG